MLWHILLCPCSCLSLLLLWFYQHGQLVYFWGNVQCILMLYIPMNLLHFIKFVPVNICIWFLVAIFFFFSRNRTAAGVAASENHASTVDKHNKKMNAVTVWVSGKMASASKLVFLKFHLCECVETTPLAMLKMQTITTFQEFRWLDGCFSLLRQWIFYMLRRNIVHWKNAKVTNDNFQRNA